MSIGLSHKIFLQLVEGVPNVEEINLVESRTEGIVTSVGDFFKLLVEANDIFSKTSGLNDRDKLIFSENIPTDLIQKLNNDTGTTNIDDTTLRDIRLITYTASEQTGTPGAHRPGDPTIKNIKYKFAEVYNDPDYTGFQIIRYKKEIEATINFKVWGTHYQDIRERAKLLRKIINDSSWYFIHKGLKNIIWDSSHEEETWDHTQIVKSKTEKYIINFVEIKEVREKNIEQIVVQFGLA
jgi:hypothetical protein